MSFGEGVGLKKGWWRLASARLRERQTQRGCSEKNRCGLRNGGRRRFRRRQVQVVERDVVDEDSVDQTRGELDVVREIVFMDVDVVGEIDRVVIEGAFQPAAGVL